MTQNVQVIKQGNENNASVLRRFTRRVQRSGVLREAKKHRYYKRPVYSQMKKKQKLNRLKKSEEIKWLVKIGRVADKYNSR